MTLEAVRTACEPSSSSIVPVVVTVAPDTLRSKLAAGPTARDVAVTVVFLTTM